MDTELPHPERLSERASRAQLEPQALGLDSHLPTPSKLAENSLARRDPQSPTPSYLELPLDIHCCIVDHLEPATGIALALSCKTLYNRFFESALKKLRHPSTTITQRQGVHLMLEQERGGRAVYCHSCDALHDFSPFWQATDKPRYIKNPRSPCYGEPYSIRNSCKLRSKFELVWHYARPFGVDYHLARLVMNRHLLGATAGLPLSCLEVQNLSQLDTRLSQPFTWNQTWRASIIDDELYLSAVHTFRQPHVGDRFARSFRNGLSPFSPHQNDLTKIRLCSHTDLRCSYSRNSLPCLDARGPFSRASHLFAPCRKEQSSCMYCLTDFTTTITWIDRSNVLGTDQLRACEQDPTYFDEPGLWRITITTYHQLGKCRSPADWKWQLAAEQWSTFVRPVSCPAGTVQHRWEEYQLAQWRQQWTPPEIRGGCSEDRRG